MKTYTEIELIKLAKQATSHVLNAICDDPRKYWLMGPGTESFWKLTEAYAAIHGVDVVEVRKNFQPDKAQYQRYIAEKEENECLLREAKEKLPAVRG